MEKFVVTTALAIVSAVSMAACPKVLPASSYAGSEEHISYKISGEILELEDHAAAVFVVSFDGKGTATIEGNGTVRGFGRAARNVDGDSYEPTIKYLFDPILCVATIRRTDATKERFKVTFSDSGAQLNSIRYIQEDNASPVIYRGSARRQ